MTLLTKGHVSFTCRRLIININKRFLGVLSRKTPVACEGRIISSCRFSPPEICLRSQPLKVCRCAKRLSVSLFASTTVSRLIKSLTLLNLLVSCAVNSSSVTPRGTRELSEEDGFKFRYFSIWFMGKWSCLAFICIEIKQNKQRKTKTT